MYVGEKVIILSPKEHDRIIKPNSIWWNPSMDQTIGREYNITDIQGSRIKCGTWFYKEEWIEDSLLRLINEATK